MGKGNNLDEPRQVYFWTNEIEANIKWKRFYTAQEKRISFFEKFYGDLAT
jgi:hypothetical protein